TPPRTSPGPATNCRGRSMRATKWAAAAAVFAAILSARGLMAQVTSSITYQGTLFDGGAPVEGSFDIRVSLYARQADDTALATLDRNAVNVSGGIFAIDVGPLFLDV